ncbi:dihydrofolate reductase [Nocardia sp. ET3-3]|uniref:Dihydrofolate reductase n=1 Tax=Nocardia terrae TaxID=2675851 RepID=A0A7K1UZ84_9NOCA|nr:dihydrofolate reductase [Nocardia terrae]
MRKLVYYVAVSLDGYIAGPQDEVEFYPIGEDMMGWFGEAMPDTVPTHVREMIGMPIDTPNRHFDTVLMGRGSYEPGLAAGTDSPFNHLKQYVFSRTLAPVENPQVEVVSGDAVELVRRLKKEEGLDIWLCGGADLAGQLLGEIDQLIIKSYPVLAGAGQPMIVGNFDPTLFKVAQRREFANGTQVTWFDRI